MLFIISVETVGYATDVTNYITDGDVVNHIACPNDAFGFYGCTLDTTVETCANYLFVECRTCKSMPSLHSLILSISFSILLVIPLPCYNGQTRLANNHTTSDGISGTVEVCVDGMYVPVCGHSEAGVESPSDVAQYICHDLGYSEL